MMGEKTKITAGHLARTACVYVRQSTPGQVLNNQESRRLQYGLQTRAKELGWQTVMMIDEDLGRSGGGGVERPGFQKLLTAVCENRIGIVLSVDASRLSRNGREWHTLLEFCAVVGCLLGDGRAIYDPGLPDDRMLLGMKGTFNEMESSVLRQRSHDARRQKAERGELFLNLPAGYVKVGRNAIAVDPDQRVRDAIQHVFRKFAEFRSIRQVFLWFRQEGIELPFRSLSTGVHGWQVVWKLPVYNTVHQILTNPIYAGAYSYGRKTRRAIIEEGRKRLVHEVRRSPEDWKILIRDNHEGYIVWDEYERNLGLIAANEPKVKGAVRNGGALLTGMLRCGHCTHKLQVVYSGTSRVGRYLCQGRRSHTDGATCISFGAADVDETVAAAVLRAVQPLGVEAALHAVEDRGKDASERARLAELALEEALFQADQARARFEAVDPRNRNVIGNLSRTWDDRLEVVRERESQLEAARSQLQLQEPTSGERAAYLALGADLEQAWNHENVTTGMRKHILRAVLVEIIATVSAEQIGLVLHWQGGDHTELSVRRRRSGQTRIATDADTDDMIREFARLMPDRAITAFLNRAGKRTGKGNNWTEARVRAYRSHRGIAVYREGEREERNELTQTEAAARLNTSARTMNRLIKSGVIPARQACKGAPWVISADALELPGIALALNKGASPSASDTEQQTFYFQQRREVS